MKKEKKFISKKNFARRESKIKHAIWGIFMHFASKGRMLIEVFIREDFGERYFRIYLAVTTFLSLAILPFLHWLILRLSMALSFVLSFTGEHEGMGTVDPMQFQTESIFPHYITWYLYLVAFLYLSIRHHKAMKRNPSVFDFARYSLSAGRIHTFFWNFEFAGKKGDRRFIECCLEPAPFFIAGVLLASIGQYLGWLLILSSVTYSISYFSAYNEGDNYVMSMIDKMIASEEMEKVFLHDADESESRGFRFVGRKPNDPAMRKTVLELMKEDGDDEEDGLLAR